MTRCAKHNEEFSESSYCESCLVDELDDLRIGISSQQLVIRYHKLHKIVRDYRDCLKYLTMAEGGHQGYTIEKAVRMARILLIDELPVELGKE